MPKKGKRFQYYYAVWGTNGVGVYKRWEKADQAMNFLSKSNNKKFDSKIEAQKKALAMYNQLSGDDFSGPLPLNITLNSEMIEQVKALNLSFDDNVVASFIDGKWNFKKG